MTRGSPARILGGSSISGIFSTYRIFRLQRTIQVLDVYGSFRSNLKGSMDPGEHVYGEKHATG